jgi:hypothetical protein
MILKKKERSERVTNIAARFHTFNSGYKVNLIRSAISGCIRRWSARDEVGMPLIWAVLGNIILSKRDSSSL